MIIKLPEIEDKIWIIKNPLKISTLKNIIIFNFGGIPRIRTLMILFFKSIRIA